MSELATKSLTAAETRVILAEVLRRELRGIFDEQAAILRPTDAQIEARIEELEKEINKLRRDARRDDFQAVDYAVRDAALTASVSLPATIEPALGRRAMDLTREIRTAQIQIEDGEEATRVVEPLVARYSSAKAEDFAKGSVTISMALEQTHRMHPKASMHATIAATGALMLEFFGDIPCDLLTKARWLEFIDFLLQLPKTHGKAHGKNRYTSNGKTLAKREEIELADLADDLVVEEVRAMDDLSLQQKRAKLAARLTPRVTVANVKKHRNNGARVIRAAQALGYAAGIELPSYKDIETRLAALNESKGDLHVRVTQPKTRMTWTEERLTQLLTSPLYTGCATIHRRWKPGSLIVRDATYWVPLILMSIGSRIEEILRLKKGSLRLRNGVECIAIGVGADEQIKTLDSERFVPIPKVLLDLGFANWMRSLPGDADTLLFPEAADRSSKGNISDAFCKHLRLVLTRLGLADFDEDIYALRKTLLTKLDDVHVPDGHRRAIAGHKQADITNKHYTAHHSKKLKEALDLVDHGLVIEFSPVHGFPVIAGCNLGSGEAPLEVNVEIDGIGQVAAVEVRVATTGEVVLSAAVAGREATVTAGPEMAVIPLQEVAAAYNRITAKAAVRLPRSPVARAAIEHLAALSPLSPSVHNPGAGPGNVHSSKMASPRSSPLAASAEAVAA